jgi:hypothetical protein
MLRAVLDGDGAEMFDAVAGALRAGVPAGSIVDALCAAAAERMLRFSTAIDLDPTIQEGWLDVTHALTFAVAVRHAIQRYRHPDVLKLVLEAARFVHNDRPLDLPEAERLSLEPARDGDVSVDGVLVAIRAKREQTAVTLAAAYVAKGLDIDPLWDALEDLAMADPATRAVFVAHYIKTTFAARETFTALAGDPLQPLPLLAVVRWLAAPIHERNIARLTHEAIQFVAHGRTPRKLTD